MRSRINVKFLLSQIVEKAARERKVVGGTYKAFFYFEGIPDYFSIYGNGLVQAIGKDESHTYYKAWANSSFASFSPEEILEQLGYQVSKIVVEGCGNNYTKIFLSFRSFLEWINLNPDELGLNLPLEKNKKDPIGNKENKKTEEDVATLVTEQKESNEEKVKVDEKINQ